MQLGTLTATTGVTWRSIPLLLQMLLQEVLMQSLSRLRRTWITMMLAVMTMLAEMTMLTTSTTSMTRRIDSSGRVASLFSLFGVLMPKGEK
jgi:hypothetical protein